MSASNPPDQSSTRCFVVTIDGPAGSGKSSVCREVAKRLGWLHVSTGVIYRAVALLCDVTTVKESVSRVAQELSWQKGTLVYRGRPFGPELYSPETSEKASIISSIPEVRARLVDLQRSVSLQNIDGLLVDGRDMGSVIFPDADLKFFLTANLDVRASRRVLQAGGMIEKVKEEIALRDRRDQERESAPLIKPADAIEIDSTNLEHEDVVQIVLRNLREHRSS